MILIKVHTLQYDYDGLTVMCDVTAEDKYTNERDRFLFAYRSTDPYGDLNSQIKDWMVEQAGNYTILPAPPIPEQ